ncbi:MAG: phosphatase PAP2 family protein [bacterium]|nr:phosphatase PAP2 family protein [bacterium]
MSNQNEKPIVDIKEVIAPPAKRSRRLVEFKHVLVLLVISFAVLSVLAKLNPYFPIDVTITRTIQQINLPFFNQLMRIVTFFGNSIPGLVIVSVITILLILMKRSKDAIFLVISSAGASFIGMVMKLLVGRPRPPEELLLNFPGYLKDNSFPSGHVLYFMGVYSFLLFLFYTQVKNIAARTIMMGICFTLLILIGISRIYLGAHWFSDTLGSYLVGSIWLYILVYFYRKVKI